MTVVSGSGDAKNKNATSLKETDTILLHAFCLF